MVGYVTLCLTLSQKQIHLADTFVLLHEFYFTFMKDLLDSRINTILTDTCFQVIIKSAQNKVYNLSDLLGLF